MASCFCVVWPRVLEDYVGERLRSGVEDAWLAPPAYAGLKVLVLGAPGTW